MNEKDDSRFDVKALTVCLILSMCANVYGFLIMPNIAKSQTDSVIINRLDPAYFEQRGVVTEEQMQSYIIPEPVQKPVIELVATPAPTPTPAAGAVSKKAALPSIQYEGATVYVTKSGKKFHRSGCSSLSKSKIPILYENATADGYTPCGKCKP